MADWQTSNGKLDRAVAGLFFLVILLPAVLVLTPWNKTGSQLTEKRQLAERPHVSMNTEALIRYPRQFERFFDDHFPFRARLIQGYNYLRIKILKQSDQRYVVMGREGWWFYTREKLLQDFTGQVTFSEEKLEGFRRMVEAKRNWLAARGIAYLFVIPPNKQSIYAEYMPENFIRARGRTRMDQLMAYMQAHSDVTIVDLRQVLIDAKARDPLYFYTDTHWNNLGALVGYGEIMRAVEHALGGDTGVIRTLDDYTVARKEGPGGDLAMMLSLSGAFSDVRFVLTPRWAGGTCAERHALPNYLESNWEFNRPPFAMICPQRDKKMVLFQDSFGTKLVPLLAEHFQRSVIIWKRGYEAALFKALMEEEQPDIVIDECGERMLYYLETGPLHRPEE